MGCSLIKNNNDEIIKSKNKKWKYFSFSWWILAGLSLCRAAKALPVGANGLLQKLQLCLPGAPTLTASCKLVGGAMWGEKAMVSIRWTYNCYPCIQCVIGCSHCPHQLHLIWAWCRIMYTRGNTFASSLPLSS